MRVGATEPQNPREEKKSHKINLVCDRKLRRAAAALPTVPVD